MTRAAIVVPRSELVRTYVFLVLPDTIEPFRSHWYRTESPVTFQVPFVVDSVPPTRAEPCSAGATVALGASAGATTPRSFVRVAWVYPFFAPMIIRESRWPRSAAAGV